MKSNAAAKLSSPIEDMACYTDSICYNCRISSNIGISLKEMDTGWSQNQEAKFLGKGKMKKLAAKLLEENRLKLSKAQELLYASNTHALLVILQGMDAAGKDGIIKNVMSGVNPQGCRVRSFKQPSNIELSHDFLWRHFADLPEKGMISIFNRSYYEEVLIVKVHGKLLEAQNLPYRKYGNTFWKHRYEDIVNFERHLVRNGTTILKFFLHISRDEQKKRFAERLQDPSKFWKFSAADLEERQYWNDYLKAYEDMINNTSTKWAPWHVVPADSKWLARSLVSELITASILSLGIKFPTPNKQQLGLIQEARRKLSL
jgi:PPK2 family polyphosphate:nucleotide phosphotransferase